jgi:hypothetical protein
MPSGPAESHVRFSAVEAEDTQESGILWCQECASDQVSNKPGSLRGMDSPFAEVACPPTNPHLGVWKKVEVRRRFREVSNSVGELPSLCSEHHGRGSTTSDERRDCSDEICENESTGRNQYQ